MTQTNKTSKHKWVFAPRFRREAYGWRSATPIKRIKEAVSEIKKVARKDPVLAAEGAVLFLEKVSPALTAVDSSSGALGTAVNRAVETLAPVIAAAPAGDEQRDRWLARLWDAVQEDEMPYIELLPEYWGEMCVTPERASRWADDFVDTVRLAWHPEHRGWFKGTDVCLSCLFKAGRYQDLLELLKLAPNSFWHYHKWGVQALAAMGNMAAALRYAEGSRGLNDNPGTIAGACEQILLDSGMVDEAYTRYAIAANQKTTYLATFRAIVKKYPHKTPADILEDLIAGTPGNEGKWFAAAKSIGLYDLAIKLANTSPCEPLTLARAARDAIESEPSFAVEAGVTAIHWLVEGYGYEITGYDVRAIFAQTMEAAAIAGCRQETFERVTKLVAGEFGERFVTKVLGRELGLG